MGVLERWAEPVIPISVESDSDVIVLDGQVRQDVTVTLKPKDVERIRTGHICIKCWNPHPSPFPFACGLCGYGMNKFQSEDFAQIYGGSKEIGPSTSVDDEIAMMRERKQRGIWLPPNAAA